MDIKELFCRIRFFKKAAKGMLLMLGVVAFQLVPLSSCQKDEETIGENIDIYNIEGTYIGIFTDQRQHELAYEGNITITRLSGGTYNIDLVCDGHGLHAKAEAVKIERNSNGELHIANATKIEMENLAEWWYVSGQISFLICSKSVYGISQQLYYFRNGKKVTKE